MIQISSTLRLNQKTTLFPVVRDLYRLEEWQPAQGRWRPVTGWVDRDTADVEIAHRRYPARPYAVRTR